MSAHLSGNLSKVSICSSNRRTNLSAASGLSQAMKFQVSSMSRSAARVILTRNFAGMFEFFEERTDGSRASGRDVFLPAREKPCHVGRFQVLLVSSRVHENRIGSPVDSEHHRSFGAMNLAKYLLRVSLEISN
jgi:hypothetical protein